MANKTFDELFAELERKAATGDPSTSATTPGSSRRRSGSGAGGGGASGCAGAGSGAAIVAVNFSYADSRSTVSPYFA